MTKEILQEITTISVGFCEAILNGKSIEGNSSIVVPPLSRYLNFMLYENKIIETNINGNIVYQLQFENGQCFAPSGKDLGKNNYLWINNKEEKKANIKINISEKEKADKDYYGYESVYHVEYEFSKQRALVDLEIFYPEKNTIRINSITDGYHWLQFFLCQKIDTEKLEEGLTTNEVVKRCREIFKPFGFTYTQEDKETAWITYPKTYKEEEVVKILADEIGKRFANRERFFN